MGLGFSGCCLAGFLDFAGLQYVTASLERPVLRHCALVAVYPDRSSQVVARIGSLRLTGLATSVASVLCIVRHALPRPLAAALVAEPVI